LEELGLVLEGFGGECLGEAGLLLHLKVGLRWESLGDPLGGDWQRCLSFDP
jgi:hypothetical protein